MKYHIYELENLRNVKKKIFKDSDEEKYEKDKNGNTIPTKKMRSFIWYKKLIYSKIPSDYWTLKIDKLNVQEDIKETANIFIENHENAKLNGLGLFLYGLNGLGKTSIACAIGIEFLKLHYDVFYTTAENFIENLKESNDDENKKIYFERLESADVIIMDEFDNVYINEKTKYSLKQIQQFVKQNMSGRKVLIFSSNFEYDEIEETFNKAVFSQLKRNCEFLKFKGKDYSDKVRKKWLHKLTGKKKNFLNDPVFDKDSKIYCEGL